MLIAGEIVLLVKGHVQGEFIMALIRFMISIESIYSYSFLRARHF